MIPKRSGRSGVRLDIPGVVLGCGGLVALVFGLGEAATGGWGSLRVVGPLVTAAVLLALFVLVQATVSGPLLPLRILANRNRGGSFLTIVFAVLGMYGTFLFLTYLLQTVDHFSPLKTGVAFLPLMIVNGLAATQLASRLMPYLRTRLLIVPGLLIAAVGVALLTQLTPESSYASHVLPAEILLGLGLGLALVPCISTATNNAEPRDVGITSATTNSSQQIGASIGTALLNTIAAIETSAYLSAHSRGPNLGAQATVHGFAIASAWAAGSLLVGAVVGGILITAHPGRENEQVGAADDRGL
jgi:predicted MFS family arabinose efflux permease